MGRSLSPISSQVWSIRSVASLLCRALWVPAISSVVYRVPVEAGQCVGYVFLIPDAIAAVLWLTVNSVAGDTEHLLSHKGHIVAASFSYLFC